MTGTVDLRDPIPPDEVAAARVMKAVASANGTPIAPWIERLASEDLGESLRREPQSQKASFANTDLFARELLAKFEGLAGLKKDMSVSFLKKDMSVSLQKTRHWATQMAAAEVDVRELIELPPFPEA